MPEIGLGIDVDSTSVGKAATDLDRLNRSFEKTQAELRQTAQASGGTDRAIGAVGKTNRGFEQGLGRVNQQLDRTQRELHQTGEAAAAAGRRVQSTGVATTAFGRALAAAHSQAGRFNGIIGSTTNLVRAAQGAMLGFIGAGFIRSLQETTGRMQQINMTFQAVTGSVEAANAEMEYVTKTADALGQSVETAAGSYARMLAAADASNISLEDTRNIFEGVTAAATAFGLSQYELEGALQAVQQIISKGSVQAEELRGQLGERLPGAFAIAAQSMGMTVQELSKALELGQVSADEFVKKFGAELQDRFGGFAQAAETSGRAINELDNAMLELRKTVVTSGFQDALISVLETLTAIAASDEATRIARGMGVAFREMAENAEIAALALGALGAVFFGIPAMVAGALAALAFFTQRTVEIGGETVKIGTIIAEAWRGIADVVRDGARFAVDVVKTMVVAWADVFRSFGPVIDSVRGLFATLFDIIKREIEPIADLFWWLYNQAVEVFGSFPTAFNQTIRGMQKFYNAAKSFVQDAIATFRWLYDKVREIFGAIGEFIGNAWGAARGGVADLAERAGFDELAATIRGLGDTAEATGRKVKTTFDAAVQGVREIGQESIDDFKRLGSASADAITATGNAVRTSSESMGRAIMDITESAERNWASLGESSGRLASTIDRVVEMQRQARIELEKYGRISEQTSEELARAKREAAALAEATGEAAKATDKAAKGAKGVKDAVKEAKQEMNGFEEAWDRVASGMSLAMQEIATGGDLRFGLTGLLSSMQGVFTEMLAPVFDDLADRVADTLRGSLEGIHRALGGSKLADPAAVGAIGISLGNAAIGALNGSAEQIGSGIGSAAGAAIGSFFGPIGTFVGGALGGIGGGFLSRLFGGGADTIRPEGTVFAGTPLERRVTSFRSFSDEDDKTGAAAIAYQGVIEVVQEFEKILNDLVRETTASAKRMQVDLRDGIDVMRAVDLITLEMDRIPTVYKAKGAEERAEQFQARMLEIVDIAEQVATAGTAPLTQAQRAWREFSDQFSDENVKILRAIGFAARDIRRAQNVIRRELVADFETELLETLTDTGRATESELQAWKWRNIRALREREEAALATAREIGASEELVRSTYAAQIADTRAEYREMLRDMTEVTKEAARTIPRWLEQALSVQNFRSAQFQTIAGAPGATRADLEAARAAEIALARLQGKQRRAEAEALGVDLALIDRANAAERRTIWRRYAEQIRDLTKKVVRDTVTAAERLAQRLQRQLERASLTSSLYGSIADAPGANRGQIRRARSAELAVLRVQNNQRIEEAKKLGISLKLVEKAYAAERASIFRSYAERIANLINGRLEESIAKFQERIGRLTGWLNTLEGRRSDVLRELQQRANEARGAEQALADARRALVAGDLSPGSPQDRLRALQGQFGDAIGRARAGDADAARDAASLAQSLLGAGREFYASSPEYAKLFADVNKQLTAAQQAADRRADRIEKQLDSETFSEVTERSTAALLRALGRLNTSIGRVEDRIERQTRRLERTEAKRRVA